MTCVLTRDRLIPYARWSDERVRRGELSVRPEQPLEAGEGLRGKLRAAQAMVVVEQPAPPVVLDVFVHRRHAPGARGADVEVEVCVDGP